MGCRGSAVLRQIVKHGIGRWEAVCTLVSKSGWPRKVQPGDSGLEAPALPRPLAPTTAGHALVAQAVAATLAAPATAAYSASLADVKKWFTDNYGPNNAVLVLAGDVRTGPAGSTEEKGGGDAGAAVLVAESDGMRRVVQQVRIVAPTDATVLVTGETISRSLSWPMYCIL